MSPNEREAASDQIAAENVRQVVAGKLNNPTPGTLAWYVRTGGWHRYGNK